LKQQIIAALGDVSERFDWILSATLTGSFLRGTGLEGISDIDFVVIVDRLNAERMEELQSAYRDALEPVLARENYALRINPTLGPLKFNDERTAVLHLMLYSLPAHVEHVIQSPFTCLDWQRSDVFFKRSMADVYPVFGLQPHHFVSARRSIQDYLRDYRASVVSHRELTCDDSGYREVRREKPMTVRDRHEFAYHILRFLMQNTLKLLLRRNEAPEGELLLDQFSLAATAAAFAAAVRDWLQNGRSTGQSLPALDGGWRRGSAITSDSSRHLFTDARRRLFRHARRTEFRTSLKACLRQPRPLAAAIRISSRWRLIAARWPKRSRAAIGRVFSSPLSRSQQSLAHWRQVDCLAPASTRGSKKSTTATAKG
jgi:hypothetical protein